MVGRYHKRLGQTELLPGGKAVLILIIIFSLAVAGLELAQEFGLVRLIEI